MGYRGENPERDKQMDALYKRTVDYLSKTPEQRKKENEYYKKKVEYYKNNKEANDKRKTPVKELQKATESAQNTNNTFIPLEDSNGRTQSELYRIKENNQATNSRTRSELYRAQENIKEANRKDSFGNWLGKQVMAGVDTFNKGIAATADFILPTEILGKYDFVSNINDYYNKSYNNRVSAAQRSSASRGKGWKTAGDLVSGTIAALPNAGISLMTAGLSGAANGISSLGTAASSASKFGNTANAVKDTVKTMVKNPMYWTSAAQTLGTDYEEAKERGANDLIATAAAIITTALNAGIEVGGGIETLPQNIKSGGRKAILEWVKSAFEEGGEEVLQSITTNAAAKLLYDRSAPIYSTNENTAVINPIALAKDFGMGAAVGGILGAGQVGVMNTLNTAQITKTGKDLNSPDIVQAMIDTGLESPKNTESYNLAKKAQSKKGKLSDYEVGKLYYANVAQVEQETQNTQSQTVNNYGENAQSQTVNNNGQNNQNQTISNNGQNTPFSNIQQESAQNVSQTQNSGLDNNIPTDSYSNVNAENNFNNTANTAQNDIPKAADFNPNMATNLLKSQGENGAKAFDTAFQNERAKGNNISRYDFLRYFNKYYAAALVGKSKSTVDVNYSDRISQSSAMAAYTAGVKDKALELENKIKAANNVIRKNGGVLINENSRLINNGTVSYINGVAKDLGVSVEFVDSIKSQGGQSVNGSYSDGTIKISMEVLNNPNAETDEVRNMVAESIFKHEITHRTQQLAPKQFERFRDLAYEYVSSKNSSNLTEVEKQLLKEYESGVDMNYSEAVDEIVADFVGSADFAEHVAVKDKNLAQKILDVIRDILDKIGVKKYSEMDNIARAWEKAVNAAEKNVNKANVRAGKTNGNEKFSTNKNIVGNKKASEVDLKKILDKNKSYFSNIAEKYRTEINSWFNTGKMPDRGFFDLGKPSPIIKEYTDIKDNFVLRENVLLKATGFKHSISVDELSNLAEKLQEPLMIFKSDTVDDAYVIFVEMTNKLNSPVVAAVHINKKRGRYSVTDVASVHSRMNEESYKDNTQSFINSQVKKGNFVYASKKSQSWFTTFGLQLPSVVQTFIDSNQSVSQTNTEVNTFDKNNSENPSTKFSNENMNDGKADNQSNNNNDVKYSTKKADELIENAEKASADTGKITKDMPDEERSKIISQKRITVPTYNKDKFDVIKDFDIDTLKNVYASKARNVIDKLDEQFSITGRSYKNNDIDLDFEYSRRSLRESVNKQQKNYDDFVKMLSVFDDVVNNAVGIEVHDDKYKGTRREDTALKNMYVLASAFKDGDRIIPVQLEIKNYDTKENKLHFTVTLDENQRNNDVTTNLGQNQLNNGITVPSDISISDLVKSVNASNGKFLKYFPDSMLNSEQISAKQEALKADDERINQYRNGERPSYSSENSDDLVKKIQADLDILNKEYGSFEPGENAARDVRIPKQTTDTDYTRRFARTAAEAPQVSDEQAANIMNAVKEGAFSYNQITDAKAMKKAEDDFNANGYEGSIETWKSKIESGNALNKFDIAFGEYLMTEAAARNDSETFERVTAELAAEGTRNAQNTQAFRLLKKLGGAGQLIYVNRAVENIQNDLKKRYGKKAPNIEVSSELKSELARAKSQEAIDAATEKIIKSVAEQMPSTFEEKWNAWRYLAMLGNPRTHIRNIVGNGVFAPAVATKNIIATVLESGVDTASKITRGKGIERSKRRFIPKKYKDFAQTDYNMMEDIIKNGGKKEISSLINDQRKILPGPIDKLRVFNDNMLESEDGFFLKRYYKYALASYLAANKADIDTLNTQNKEGYKLLEKARNYAIKEAQKATYRDASSFATALNNFSRTNRATNFITESILPFKKTPANILKRGIEYSPLGLIDTITRGTYKLAKKQYTASEFIDGLSSGLTGTGIVALGLWMASLGLLRGSSKDDKEEFEEMEGAQTYAVYSGNKSYTIDWAAPACIPLFIGAELYRLTENDEKLNVSTVIDSLATLSEPIFEMSMLDGLNSVFEAPSKNPDDKAIVAITREMVTSYLGQAVPTLLGQTTRTFFDDTRRRSYADKNSSIPAWAQYAYQKQANKIPGLSKNQEPYIDNWGREQKTGNIYERAFENYFSPGYYSEENLSDVDIELMRLAEQATEDQNVFPQEAVKYFNVDKVRKDLTAKEYTTFQTVKGQKSYELISDIYNSEAYDDLTDEQRIDIITKLYKVANVVGKKSVSDYVSTDNWIEEAIEKGDSAIIAAAILKTCGPDYASTNGMYTALDNGVDMGTYIEFLNKTNGVKADKDKNGKTIKNSKQDKIKKILQDMDATDEEKAYLFNSEYEGSKNNPWKAYLK